LPPGGRDEAHRFLRELAVAVVVGYPDSRVRTGPDRSF
jgi:hypothetical protein